jgi:hypothetical protein
MLFNINPNKKINGETIRWGRNCKSRNDIRDLNYIVNQLFAIHRN